MNEGQLPFSTKFRGVLPTHCDVDDIEFLLFQHPERLIMIGTYLLLKNLYMINISYVKIRGLLAELFSSLRESKKTYFKISALTTRGFIPKEVGYL